MKQDAYHNTDTSTQLKFITGTCTLSLVTSGIKTDPEACSTKCGTTSFVQGVLCKPYTSPNYSHNHWEGSIEHIANLQYVKTSLFKI